MLVQSSGRIVLPSRTTLYGFLPFCNRRRRPRVRSSVVPHNVGGVISHNYLSFYRPSFVGGARFEAILGFDTLMKPGLHWKKWVRDLGKSSN